MIIRTYYALLFICQIEPNETSFNVVDNIS